MIEIERNQEKGKELILEWSKHWRTIPNNPSFSEDIFILKKDNDPVILCGLTTSEDGNYIRCYGMVKNPKYSDVKEEMGLIFDHLCLVAKERGFKSIMLFAPNDKLVNIYSRYGFNKECDAVIPMKKEL